MSATVADRPAWAEPAPAGYAGVVSRTIAYVLDTLIVSIASGKQSDNGTGIDGRDVWVAMTPDTSRVREVSGVPDGVSAKYPFTRAHAARPASAAPLCATAASARRKIAGARRYPARK